MTGECYSALSASVGGTLLARSTGVRIASNAVPKSDVAAITKIEMSLV